jgi:chemotaxis signal transduction protein|uniref:CheW-like domain-containing protein n=1 Tax=candidate division WOR-3 bacterium TaxID=2052148 RepID=A0A7C4YGN7_UNCW3
MKCIVFTIGEYLFGADIEDVKEVGKKKNAKIISSGKGFSIIKYRDKNFVIFELSEIFDLKDAKLENILFFSKFDDIGVTIGEIKGMFDVKEKSIPRDILELKYIKSFGDLEDKTIFIIDTDQIAKRKKIKGLIKSV